MLISRQLCTRATADAKTKTDTIDGTTPTELPGYQRVLHQPSGRVDRVRVEDTPAP